MRIGIPREHAPGERRVAAVPETAAALVDWGWDVALEPDAGTAAGHPDDAYSAIGASLVDNAHEAAIVLRVGPPTTQDLQRIPEGATVLGFLDPFVRADLVGVAVERRLTAIAVEAIPRTTQAQGMDALSSQANIAGYAAVLVAATISPRLLPMMVTAAGTIPPCRALVLGVGVAGLQAIATAKRLGAVVHAYDVRRDTREQVESLGARFVEAPTMEADEAGYAVEVAADGQARQRAALAPFVADSDLIVTNAQIPGRPAPLLVTEEMVRTMRPGSVIVDAAAATGGNVAVTRPDDRIDIAGVTVVGPTNLPAMYPVDASRMYARNLLAVLERVHERSSDGVIDLADEILGETAVVAGGRVRHPLTGKLLEETR